MIAADNWQPEATWRVWRFGEERQGDIVLQTPWDEQVIHVSHCNARPGRRRRANGCSAAARLKTSS